MIIFICVHMCVHEFMCTICIQVSVDTKGPTQACQSVLIIYTTLKGCHTPFLYYETHFVREDYGLDMV